MRAFSAAGRSSHIQELERRFAFATLKDGTVLRHIPGSLEEQIVNESYHNGSTNSVASTPSNSSNSDDSDVESTAEAEILMNEDFSKRSCYTDAAQAPRQINKGKAFGYIPALQFRSWLQSFLFSFDCFAHRSSYLVLFFGLLLILGLFCVGLKGVKIESEIESVWVEKGGPLDSDRSFVSDIAEQYGMDSTAASFQVVIQTPLRGRGTDSLSKSDLLAHVDLALNVTQMEIEMFEMTLRSEYICFEPDPPRLSEELAMLHELFQGAEQSASTSLLKRRSLVPPMFHPFAGDKFKIDIIVYAYSIMVIFAAFCLLGCKARGLRSPVHSIFMLLFLVGIFGVSEAAGDEHDDGDGDDDDVTSCCCRRFRNQMGQLLVLLLSFGFILYLMHSSSSSSSSSTNIYAEAEEKRKRAAELRAKQKDAYQRLVFWQNNLDFKSDRLRQAQDQDGNPLPGVSDKQLAYLRQCVDSADEYVLIAQREYFEATRPTLEEYL